MRVMRRFVFAVVGISCAWLPWSTAQAQKTTRFPDVPAEHFATAAVEALAEKGIIAGYPDGTFRPSVLVTRAEAVKIALGATGVAPVSDMQKSSFTDVPEDAWYAPFVEAARREGIITGNAGSTSFAPERPVSKSEFLALLLRAFGIDAGSAYGEIRLPLSPDARSADTWFYPLLRYALASSLTTADGNGLLSPSRMLPRGEVAVLLWRLMKYREGQRSAVLLAQSETELRSAATLRTNSIFDRAEEASARALLEARGALSSAPENLVAKGIVKIAEAHIALLRALRAQHAKEWAEAIRLAGDAWNLAARGRDFNADLTETAAAFQSAAKSIAETGRTALAKTH